MRRIELPGKMMRQYGVNRRNARSVGRKHARFGDQRATCPLPRSSIRKFIVAFAKPGRVSALKSSPVNSRAAVACRGGATTTAPITTSRGGRSCSSRNPVRRRDVEDRLLPRRVQDALRPGLPKRRMPVKSLNSAISSADTVLIAAKTRSGGAATTMVWCSRK